MSEPILDSGGGAIKLNPQGEWGRRQGALPTFQHPIKKPGGNQRIRRRNVLFSPSSCPRATSPRATERAVQSGRLSPPTHTTHPAPDQGCP